MFEYFSELLIKSTVDFLIRIKHTKGLSEKYKRETLADLKNQLEKIKRVIPKKHERFIEIECKHKALSHNYNVLYIRIDYHSLDSCILH